MTFGEKLIMSAVLLVGYQVTGSQLERWLSLIWIGLAMLELASDNLRTFRPHRPKVRR